MFQRETGTTATKSLQALMSLHCAQCALRHASFTIHLNPFPALTDRCSESQGATRRSNSTTGLQLPDVQPASSLRRGVHFQLFQGETLCHRVHRLRCMWKDNLWAEGCEILLACAHGLLCETGITSIAKAVGDVLGRLRDAPRQGSGSRSALLLKGSCGKIPTEDLQS